MVTKSLSRTKGIAVAAAAAAMTALLSTVAHGAESSADKKTADPSSPVAVEDKKIAPTDGSTFSTCAAPSDHDEKGVWTELPRPDDSWAGLAEKKGRKPIWKLTQEEQDKILHSKTSPIMMGSFYEFTNFLYCAGAPFIMTTSVDASKIHLHTVHDTNYKPTNAELVETMARQTKTSLKYDPSFFSKWVAAPPAMPLPYSVKVADDWRPDDRGSYVSYIPKLQPVGMDIYIMGRYSGLSPEESKTFRNSNALKFAKMFDNSITTEKMQEVKVDESDAIYWETSKMKRPNCRWRQWSLIKNGEAFVIVSTIADENASKLWPEVQAMVASFHVTEPAPTSPGL